MLRWWETSIWLLVLIAAAVATQYECLSYPVRSTCRIEYISYHPGDQIAFPSGYQQYQIKAPSSFRKAKSKVVMFDSGLYEAMHRPSSIEMTSTSLEELTLPAELLLGDFSDNHLITVHTQQEENYQITYLDLSSNMLHHVHFVSRLVNLETLHLEKNAITHVSDSALRSLPKLKYLYLQRNAVVRIPWSSIPRSLIHLDCETNRVERVEFSNVSLPSLQYLNLQYNVFPSVNVTDLIRTAPNLEEANLYNGHIDIGEMREIMTELTANNVCYVDIHSWCTIDQEYDVSSGMCVQQPEELLLNGKLYEIAVPVVSATLFVCMLLHMYKFLDIR
nr:leucine-rich repeat transmembrane protein FLRT3-like [Aedes albopictus]